MEKKIDITEKTYLLTQVIPNIAVDWQTIGLELDVPHEKLTLIRNEFDHVSAQCYEMLEIWFKRGETEKQSECLNWKNMYDAMRALDLNARAEELKILVLKEYEDPNDPLKIN